jgi:hypothetical protein
MLPRWVALLNYPHLALDHYSPAGHPTLTAPSLEEPFCAFACYCRGRTCTCFCGVLPQHIPPVGCEHFVVVGLTRIEADTMTPRDYKSRKSTRLGPERVLSLHLRC